MYVRVWVSSGRGVLSSRNNAEHAIGPKNYRIVQYCRRKGFAAQQGAQTFVVRRGIGSPGGCRIQNPTMRLPIYQV